MKPFHSRLEFFLDSGGTGGVGFHDVASEDADHTIALYWSSAIHQSAIFSEKSSPLYNASLFQFDVIPSLKTCAVAGQEGPRETWGLTLTCYSGLSVTLFMKRSMIALEV